MKRFMGFFFVTVLLFALPLAAQTASKATDNSAALSAKLEKVLLGQQQILQKLDEVKSELQIVKMRATAR